MSTPAGPSMSTPIGPPSSPPAPPWLPPAPPQLPPPPPSPFSPSPDGAILRCSNVCSLESLDTEVGFLPGLDGDGQCEDGGVGSTRDLCDLGTDCIDCGPRVVNISISSPALPSAPPLSPPPVSPFVAPPFPVAELVVLLCIFLVLPLCFIWYRRKCDRNRDVCVFPTCICRFFAVHFWRLELAREYNMSQKQKAEQNREADVVASPVRV